MNTKSFKGIDGLDIVYDRYDVENPDAVLQVIHGSVEHGLRYKHFAEFMQSKNIAVYVMDIRGHGRSLKTELGVLSDTEDSWGLIVKEQYELTKLIKEDYPNKKIVVMGHSMGSFILRDYLYFYSSDIDAAILSGTGSSDPITVMGGKLLLKKERKKLGYHTPSAKLTDLVFGPLNKKAQKMGIDSFVSRDQSVIDKYNADPACGYDITVDYAKAMIDGLGRIIKSSAYDIANIPIMLFSGEKDPVGGTNSKYVKGVAKKYAKNGNDVEMYIYDDALHEMINEINKEEVYGDVLNWIGEHI